MNPVWFSAVTNNRYRTADDAVTTLLHRLSAIVYRMFRSLFTQRDRGSTDGFIFVQCLQSDTNKSDEIGCGGK